MAKKKKERKLEVGVPIVFIILIGLITVMLFSVYFLVFLDPIEIEPVEDLNFVSIPEKDEADNFLPEYDLRNEDDFVNFIFLQWEFQEILSEFYDYNEYIDELLRVENLEEIPGIIEEINAGRFSILKVLSSEISNLAEACGNDAFCLDHEFGLKALVKLDNAVQKQIAFYEFNEFGERDRQFYRYGADKAFSEIVDYELFFEYDLVGKNEELSEEQIQDLVYFSNVDLNLAAKSVNLKTKCDEANDLLANNDNFKFFCAYSSQQKLDLISRLLAAENNEELDVLSESCELEKLIIDEEECLETREYLNSLKENLLLN